MNTKQQYERWLLGILAVIAVNLSLLSLHVLGVLPRVEATHSAIQHIALPTDSTGALRVRIAEGIIPVRIQEVGYTTILGELPVRVEDNVLRVKVENEPLEVRSRN